MPRNR